MNEEINCDEMIIKEEADHAISIKTENGYHIFIKEENANTEVVIKKEEYPDNIDKMEDNWNNDDIIKEVDHDDFNIKQENDSSINDEFIEPDSIKEEENFLEYKNLQPKTSDRKRDITWLSFDEVKKESRKGVRAKCKKCGYELEGHVVRMKSHLLKCAGPHMDVEDSDVCEEDSVSDGHTRKRKSDPEKWKRNVEKRESNDGSTRISVSGISDRSIFNRPSSSAMNVSGGGLLTFLDHMDNQLNESLNQSLAKAIFISGAPLAMVEHPLWIEFFKKIRPSYKPPSRYRLTSTYLKAQYTEMQNEVTSQLKDSKHLHLQCDGWSNIRNESIVNFIVSKPEPLFVEFVATKENRHNSPYLAELIINVLEKHGPDKFLVIIGDNACNMRAALALVKEKHPSIVPLGCLAHLLHLLCQDILKCNTVKSFMGTIIDIVKTIKNSHVLKAMFDRFQLEKKFNKDRVSLKLPGQTRWGSTLFCLQSLLSNKSVLQKLAVSEEANISSEMKRQLLDDGVFWPRVEKMVNILDPIIELITAFESNTPMIHKVYTKFNNLQSTLQQEIPESPLQKSEEKNVLTKLGKRIEFGVGQIHFAADLLNPSSQGCKLKPEELLDAISFICEVGSSMGLKIVDIRQNLADYRDKEGLWRRSFIWEGVKDSEKEKAISPMLWWRELRGICVLADVAVRILGAPVTSAATERTFSWIHCKKRNRLTTERAGQITYLSHNWNLLNNTVNTRHPKPQKREKNKEDGCENVQVEENEEDSMEISSTGSDDYSDDEDGHMSLSSHNNDSD